MTIRIHSILAVAATLALASLAPASRGALAQQPTSGYSDSESAPETSYRRLGPVYRGPSVDTLATIRRDGVLRVCVAVSEPAVLHDAEGNLIGFSIDVARQLAEDLGVEAQFVETSWSKVIPKLVEGQCDLIASGLWVTPERALVVNYSIPTGSEGLYVVASRRMAANKSQQSDFNQPSVRLAVFPGTVQESVAKATFPNATLVPVPDDSYDLGAVLAGQADAALVPSFAPRLYVESAPEELYLPFEEPIRSTHIALAVRKGDPDFLNYLDTWIRFHRDDGWAQDRVRYWAEEWARTP